MHRGIMKETEAWESLLPWIRNVDAGSKIGQIWFHHTGHNETRGYGTKLANGNSTPSSCSNGSSCPGRRSRLPDPKFTKAASEPRTIGETSKTRSSPSPTTVEFGARDGMPERVPDSSGPGARSVAGSDHSRGEIPAWNKRLPPDTLCVTEKKWREYCEKGFLTDGSTDPAKKAEADRKAFQRASKNLIGTRVGKSEVVGVDLFSKTGRCYAGQLSGTRRDAVPDMSRPFVRS